MLGLLQGVTELFPISTSGTAHPSEPVRLELPRERRLLHHLPRRAPPGTLVLFVFFWHDGSDLARLGRSLRDRGSIPRLRTRRSAGSSSSRRFPPHRSARSVEQPSRLVRIAAIGVVLPDAQPLRSSERRLYVAEPQRTGRDKLAGIGLPTALVVGAAQAIALMPGFSRSGITITAGRFLGLSQQRRALLRSSSRSRSSAPPPPQGAEAHRLRDPSGRLGGPVPRRHCRRCGRRPDRHRPAPRLPASSRLHALRRLPAVPRGARSCILIATGVKDATF